MSATVLHGDCRDVMAALPADGFDACVTDPPYHLTTGKKGGTGIASASVATPYGRARIGTGFMGKAWDGGDVALVPATWGAVMRVLKPGAHLLAFGGTRTFHRMAAAIEDAGFEIRDCVMWMYGTGFPKSHNVGGGWGTALKPAWEPIIVARKPLIGTVAENVLAHGAGAINVDGCRIGTTDKLGGGAETITRPGQKTNDGWTRPWMEDPHAQAAHAATVRGNVAKAEELGRWPANVIHDGSDEVLAAFAAYGERGAAAPVRGDEPSAASTGRVTGQRARVPGAFHADTGTAARFFYSAKASKADRAGSKHPTVKPIALMRYLCRLVTPPGGRILDPFAGSGTTGQAALEEGFTPTLIEAEAEYVADIQRRLAIKEAERAACAPTEERQGVLL